MDLASVRELVENMPLIMLGVCGSMLALIFVLHLVAEKLPD